MILPTKHIPAERALIGVGAILLQNLERPRTVSDLWEKVKDSESVGNFERFILGLDLLHMLGTITLSKGLLVKVSK